MIENKYELTMEEKGNKAITKSGGLPPDKFKELVSDPAGILAKVSITVGESTEYGGLKISATVTLTCDQNEAKIDRAAESAFFKAADLVKEGFTAFEAQGKVR